MVALRKESVDRNVPANVAVVPAEVALRKESVDRNIVDEAKKAPTIESLSARRAWIEITRTLRYARLRPRRSPQGERG